MRRYLFALILATASMPALAQGVPAGSGIEPSTVANSQARPIAFANRAAEDGVLVILMRNADLPTGVLGSAAEASVKAAIANAKFDGKDGSDLTLRGIGRHARIDLVGMAGDGDVADRLRRAGGRIAQAMRDEAHPVSIVGAASDEAATVALGYSLGQYRFDRYRTVGKSVPSTQPATIIVGDVRSAETEWKSRGAALAEGVTLTRDLSTEPANVIYPESFVARVREAFAGVPGVKIEVLDEATMRRLGMGTLAGVGQGSRRPPRLMLVEYRGGNGTPIALVGKGITFDSGGTSIKPAAGMWEMKSDMAGAAATMGAVLSLAKSRANVNVLAVAALAENMPGGNAQRPGDVVRTFSGKTVEVINTDAEGRLVLADANEYVIANHKPAALVNIATLTGAVGNALGYEYAGLLTRDDAIAAQIAAAGKAVGEEVWRLPLHPNHLKTMKSDIADIKNSAEGGRPGASLGAAFIGFFVDPVTPWAHLDIAGVNWADSADDVTPKGASGWGVRILDEFVRNWKR
ncbi:leucyl aminopeptidase [Sphingorhabdus pulchriflava]|uniref:Probable cytosol aminopeptidase n=1 Tax=Sphingorhabdus pulchriflava TaxID=2292257 RepID=A0A371B5Q1_9SPHN|nr:leucyl aminopeptidase [Sphingorhabdus pulchriflava]RDV02773.1 leucyl aminopeptidase [Sphingorhabdus pulchriflava]